MATEQPTSGLQNLGIAIEIVFPALAFICVCFRVYHRLKKGNHGWGVWTFLQRLCRRILTTICLDDALIVVAMALSIALAVGSIKGMYAYRFCSPIP